MVATKAPAAVTDRICAERTVLGADALRALTGALGWQLTYLRSGTGPLVSRAVVRRVTDCFVLGTTTRHALELRGTMPTGMGAVLLAAGDGARCCGQTVRSGQLGLLLGVKRADLQIPRGTAALVIVAPEPFITAHLGLVATYRMRSDDHAVMKSRVCLVESARSDLRAALAAPTDPERSAAVDAGALASLATLLRDAKPVRASNRDSRSHRILCAAEDYIDAHLAESISLAVLARHAGISPRSLQRLFRRVLGTTPVGYIRMRRLNAVQQALMDDTVPGKNITSAALACGFGHLGRFAAEYRTYFGLLPSEARANLAGPGT